MPTERAVTGLARASSYKAVVLCLSNVIAFVDRTTLPLLVQRIEADLQISDTQMSLLVGLAFILAYSSAGLVAAACSTGSRVAGCWQPACACGPRQR